MKQISILGCGWLGLPLAKSLVEKGFSVNGSTTSLEKVSVIENNGITAFQIEVKETEIKGEIDSFLAHSEILIIDIPPKLRGTVTENFVAKIQTLIPFIEKSAIAKVIFVSSTAVYSDDNTIITEDTIPQPNTESGKQLLAVETLLQNNSRFKTIIVRFGGLIGDDRHPIKFLSGRKNLENPEAPINLIHQIDCIGILENIINTNSFGEIVNAVAPFHPTRKDYYTQKAQELNLPLPEFETNKTSFGKTILSTKIEAVLNYQFKNSTL
jgi:nucleoside-diphosphate-sugar epimerase